ncbi:MAG: hypothetical protein E7551_09845 [Ruminococcaceae bacterium]|nr:hypothetical protein [Oscillospiraceae bacterium]
MDKKCCFAGHNEIFEIDLQDKLNNILIKLIKEENVKEFYVGNYGEFDKLVYRTLYKIKNNEFNDIIIHITVPYITNELKHKIDRFKIAYKDIIIPEFKESIPMKLKILKTNQYMVDHGDYLVCYVKHSWGGAATTLEYAQKRNKIRILKI